MNEKLALSDDILLSCSKPERYIGNEVNSVTKDLKDVKIRFAFCFPDVYEIGMSHLGIQILYGMFNSYDDVWCERVYSPWTDMDQVMRDNKIPLFALESQDPVHDFDFLGFTLQYELCYTNILQVLDLSGIPFTSVERTDWTYPIVIGGGPCTYNPEPIADFFDIFYIGEGENHYRALFDLYEQCKADGTSRKDFLIKAASIPGMYIPSLYEVKYKEDGTIESMNPTVEGIPSHITKDIVTDLDHAFYPSKPVVPFIKATQDRIVLEVMRGCIRGCRFCQAGQLYRPKREKSHEVLEKQAVELLKNTGYEEISLSSLSTSDYEQLPQLLDFLLKECGSKHVNISLPSLRIDNFSLDVMSKVQDIKKSSLTFAAEAGSQRLRDVINKGVTEEDILRGSHEAFLGGWNKVKFYFMLGHPWETDEDIAGIGEICNKVAAEYFDTVPKEKRNGQSVEITASTSFFVPKPFTPFQWAPMCKPEEFLEKAAKTKAGIRSQINQKRIKYNWHEANASMLEGVFARGDRKLCKAILRAYEKGCIYDAWGEYFKYDVWMETFEELGIDPWFYVSRTRPDDEIFPWDILDCGVTKSFLLREWHTSQEAKISKNCANQCMGCGAKQYGVGICMEPKTDKNVGYAV